MSLTTVLAVWAGIGPLAGIYFGHGLTRQNEGREKRECEFCEVLGTLATAYTMMQRHEACR